MTTTKLIILRVIETVEGNVHVIVQSVLAEDVYQDGY
jgi:hypothetical protein